MKYAAMLMVLGGALLLWPDAQLQPVHGEIHGAYAEMGVLMETVANGAIDRLESGAIEDDKQMVAFMDAARKKAEDVAFGPLEARQATAMRDGWTARKQIDHLMDLLQ